MILSFSAAPLLAVDAVALDLETTGLDTRSARILQIGAIPLRQGRLDLPAALSTLVDPGVPIPASATAIHGIDDRAVVGAPSAAEAQPKLAAFITDRLVIGHSIGFDLAVLEAEARRHGAVPIRPRSLDTSLLAQLAGRSLPDYSLETLASWLGVPVAGRHTALGDAETAGRVFLALVPALRERGIRTVAEAEAACLRLAQASTPLQPTIAAASDTASSARSVFGRIDAYPYRHRVRDVMSAPARFADPGASLLEAARTMSEGGVSALLVAGVEADGILTERDVLRAVAAEGAAALDAPAASVASFPLATVTADSFVYRAVGRMDRLGIRHLGVVDATGEIVGMLSARDLLRLRASEAIRLGNAIETADSVAALACAWAPLPAVAEALVAEGVEATTVAAVVSAEITAATRRAAELAEAELAAEGVAIPGPYAVLVLGSAGRGESLLALDQDNAIIFAAGEPDGPEDGVFARLGTIIAGTLDTVGVPFCKGGVMAKNAEWRGSVATWKERLALWQSRSEPQDLLSVDIFFDGRAVHGDIASAEALLSEFRTEAAGAPNFLKLMAEATPRPASPFGLFGHLRTENGRIDLKRAALLPLVSDVRVLAIRHGVAALDTQGRLAGLRQKGIGGDADLERLAAAHKTVLRLILTQQLQDLRDGTPPSTKVAVGGLPRADHEELRDALKAVAVLDNLVRDLLF